MYKLESDVLKREFKIVEEKFFASQILNKKSNMSFVPDGNGYEFLIRFVDGDEYSSKGLPVEESCDENGILEFKFAENMGVSVSVKYWVHDDKKTLCKQLVLNQKNEKAIDFVLLDCVGIVNSTNHFSNDVSDFENCELNPNHVALGQPFYIDSLFFGCEFPATENRIIHATGQIKYYIGKSVGENYLCPTTVIGGGSGNTLAEVQKAFFEYIEAISVKTSLRFQYNSWFDKRHDINNQNLTEAFRAISSEMKKRNINLDCYTIDDGWNNYKKGFWNIDEKKFPNGLGEISTLCDELGGTFGMWLGPRGGYGTEAKFAKKIQRAKNGFVNNNAKDICVNSTKYVDAVNDFLCDTVSKNNIEYLKLDGFCIKACTDDSHDHVVGGENDMYFVTELWQKWIEVFKNLRKTRKSQGKDLFINMTCYTNVSAWWLQWVNSLWLQDTADIEFSKNEENQSAMDATVTYRDSRYFACLCKRQNQFPTKNLFNHDPIYANHANEKDKTFTDEEFEKYIYWCACRGAALNELYISPNMMNGAKWQSLADAISFQKANFEILKNATFLGGNPVENNIYGFVSWSNDEGIIAMRNPTSEETALTLTINKLMGTPENLADVTAEMIISDRKNNHFSSMGKEYSYNDKINITLKPFEMLIFKLKNNKQ